MAYRSDPALSLSVSKSLSLPLLQALTAQDAAAATSPVDAGFCPSATGPFHVPFATARHLLV